MFVLNGCLWLTSALPQNCYPTGYGPHAPAPALSHPLLYYLPYYGWREHSDECRIDCYHRFRKLPHRALKFLKLVSVEKEDDSNYQLQTATISYYLCVFNYRRLYWMDTFDSHPLHPRTVIQQYLVYALLDHLPFTFNASKDIPCSRYLRVEPILMLWPWTISRFSFVSRSLILLRNFFFLRGQWEVPCLYAKRCPSAGGSLTQKWSCSACSRSAVEDGHAAQ